MTIADSIKTTLPETDNAKEFMRLVRERSQPADKSLARTSMSTLITMYYGTLQLCLIQNIREH